MQNITTQNNTAKKQWQKPDFYIIDRNEDVNGGAIFQYLEGQQEPGKIPGLDTQGPAAQYFS